MTETQANPDTLAAGSGLINWFWVSIELNHAMHRRHRLQGCLGFAWVSYVIMPAAEELFAKAGRGGLSPLRKAPPRGAASAGSRHEIRKTGAKVSWGKTQEAVLYLQSIEKFICWSTSAPWGKTQDKPRQPGLASRSRRRLLARPSGAREPSSKSKMQ